MTNKSMGELICGLRKEKGMTQRELAEQMNVTDKAVSKWERDLSCPDINSLPRLAEVLGISVEELLNTPKKDEPAESKAGAVADLVLRAIPVAMGVAVIVTSLLQSIDLYSGFSMLGIGLACTGISLLRKEK